MIHIVPFSSDYEKSDVPPFGRADTACYPLSLLGKAYQVYSLPQVFLSSKPPRLVKSSALEGMKPGKRSFRISRHLLLFCSHKHHIKQI